MNVLSLFDGMSCGQVALERAGIRVDSYLASEIDEHAMTIARKNYPKTIHLGDVTKLQGMKGIDLLIGGSPCQGFSFAGKQLNFDDPRSKLFFEFHRILQETQPRYFLLENVKMKKESMDVITEMLGVEPIEINSSLVSAQNRARLYWTNIPGIKQPLDKGILLKDIVFTEAFGVAVRGRYKEDGATHQVVEANGTEKANALTTVQKDSMYLVLSDKALEYMDREVKGGRNHWDFAHHSDVRKDKSAAVVANFFKGVPYNVFKDWDCIRKFHPIECERLQTLPDNYTEGVSNTQRYKMIGNGWTVDVIAHIFEAMKADLNNQVSA